AELVQRPVPRSDVVTRSRAPLRDRLRSAKSVFSVRCGPRAGLNHLGNGISTRALNAAAVLALLLLSLSQPYPRAATVFVDELNTGGFEGTSYSADGVIRNVPARFLKVHDGGQAQTCQACKLRLGHFQERPCGAALSRREINIGC